MVPSRHDDAAPGQKIQRRADRRPRDPDQVRELLLATMARLKLGVADDIQDLVGQPETAGTGRTHHDRGALEDDI